MKTYTTEGTSFPQSQIGDALESLARVIHARRHAEKPSYTHKLLTQDIDVLLKKIQEESFETALAAKDLQALKNTSHTSLDYQSDLDHFRYEVGDLLYHLMVLLEREGISLDEVAAELNSRMSKEALAQREGIVMLKPEFINRGNHQE